MKKEVCEVKDRVAIVTDVLRNHKGRMLSVWFIKKNGEQRLLNGRFGVSKGVNGKGMNHDPASIGQLPIFEIKPRRNEKGVIIGNDEQWRTIDFHSIIALKMRGRILLPNDLWN